MKVLEFGHRTPQKWAHNAICTQGSITTKPGCNAKLVLEVKDLFKQVLKQPNGMIIGCYFRCPCCGLDNYLEPKYIPTDIEIPTKTDWMLKKRDDLIYELFELSETPEDTIRIARTIEEESSIDPELLKSLGYID